MKRHLYYVVICSFNNNENILVYVCVFVFSLAPKIIQICNLICQSLRWHSKRISLEMCEPDCIQKLLINVKEYFLSTCSVLSKKEGGSERIAIK